MSYLTSYKIIRCIPYSCVIALAVIIFLVCVAGFFGYRFIKLNIYNNLFYISVRCDYDINEIKSWIYDNINGLVWIEDDICHEEEWLHGCTQQTLLGWTIRFTHKSDAIAFKLRWVTLDDRIKTL